MDPELKAYLEGMFHNLTQQIAESRQHAEQLNQETRQDLMAHTDRRIHETQVLIEDVRHEVQLVAEGVTTVRDQLGRVLDDHEERITRLERRRP
ncbi:MAG: hypothetical protein M1499_01140 [Firmicutes bacterium]|nr:hypothetical protein [Bacillota bacterium]